MISRLYSFLSPKASLKSALLLFIAAQLVYGIIMLYSIPSVSEYSNGIKLFDLSPLGYSADHARNLLDALGENGRELYLYRQIPLDFIYPLLFSLAYIVLMIYLQQKNLPKTISQRLFILFPLFAGLFDYLENISIISLLISYPYLPVSLVGIASLFTILKSIFTTLTLSIILIYLVSLTINKLSKKKDKKEK